MRYIRMIPYRKEIVIVLLVYFGIFLNNYWSRFEFRYMAIGRFTVYMRFDKMSGDLWMDTGKTYSWRKVVSGEVNDNAMAADSEE